MFKKARRYSFQIYQVLKETGSFLSFPIVEGKALSDEDDTVVHFFEEVSIKDQIKIEPGAKFQFVVQYRDTKQGRREKISFLKFIKGE